ncbi:hypothetical protein CYMTET_29404 [Cymbomonas tetramitiformis]|uniref:Uncharacterized protein n=1 Tax=Cymbomonas tetramitiformis TaxID=36881 RepID=A0AAE0KV00_9CHLO|nr:hypothetical protein CYMTET_29404 [Cymbomonas tetramitiformis]
MCVKTLRELHPELDEATAKTKIIRRLNNRRNLGPKGTTIEMRQNRDIQAVNAFNKESQKKRPDLVISLTACATEVVGTPPQASPGVRPAAGAPLTATEPRRSPRNHATVSIPAGPEVARTPQRGSPGVRPAAGAPLTATVPRRSPRNHATVSIPAAPEVARTPQRGSPATAGAPQPATVPRRSPRTAATVTAPAPKDARAPHRGSPGARSEPGVPLKATVPRPKARAPEVTEYEEQRLMKIAGNKRRLSVAFGMVPTAYEDLMREKQVLLTQVQQLDEKVLIEHVQRVARETRKRVPMTAQAVFEVVPMPGYKLLGTQNGTEGWQQEARGELREQWTKDLRKRAKKCPSLKAAFKLSVSQANTQKATTASVAPRPNRAARTVQSMAEDADDDEDDMCKVIRTGRGLLTKRMSMTATAKRKCMVKVHTDEAIEAFETDSHATFGDYFGAVVNDMHGTEREVDLHVGKTVIEHETIGAAAQWRRMGFPEIMRCHLVAADAGDEDGRVEPLARFDYSIFHGDFKVESWTFEELVGMQMKVVPAISVKRNYEVAWRDEAGLERGVLTAAECRGHFGMDRIPALRTRQFWTP